MSRLQGVTDLAAVEDLDANDSLASFRDRFEIADPGLIYVNGNSLGRLPKQTIERINSFLIDEWGAELGAGWSHWIDLSQRIGDQLASEVLGASAGEVVLSDSTSVNLYKLASAALDSMPDRKVIITDVDNFASDRYVLQGLAQARGLELRMLEGDPVMGPDVDSVSALLDEDVALVSLSHVGYRSGALADMKAITQIVRDAGALMLWDLCHSAGALPISLNDCDVDLAIGCTYKYLNGGPGSPAFLYVRKDLQDRLRQPIWGWFGQSNQFEMGADYSPVDDLRRFLVGTPPLISMIAAEQGVALTMEAGIFKIREKSLKQTELIIDLADEWLASSGFLVASPRLPEARGSHVALKHPDAQQLVAELSKQNVICDFRHPDIIRVAAAPLYNSYGEVLRSISILREIATA